jgi:hypothetical protein
VLASRPLSRNVPRHRSRAGREKPGIQAIGTTAPDLSPEPGLQATFARDHEYKRNGTVSLLAGIDLLTGKVHALVRDRHRSREFIEFHKLLDANHPTHTATKFILDNHSAHISKETKAWLADQTGPGHSMAIGAIARCLKRRRGGSSLIDPAPPAITAASPLLNHSRGHDLGDPIPPVIIGAAWTYIEDRISCAVSFCARASLGVLPVQRLNAFDAALAISGADVSRRNVMEGRTLAKAGQHQSLPVRLPALITTKKFFKTRALSLKAVEGQRT